MLKIHFDAYLHRHEYPRLLFMFPGLIRLVHGWNQCLLQRNWATRHAMKQLLPTLQPGSSIVDAGCGEGMHILPYTKRYAGFSFYGIDKNPGHIRFCTHYSQRSAIHNTVFLSHDLANPFPLPTVDAILCIGTLQYVEKDVDVLFNFNKILKCQGKLLLYIPINGEVLLPVYRYFFKKKGHYEKSQNRVRIYTEEEIVGKLLGEGFVILNKRYTHGKTGILAHEIYSLFLMGISSGGMFSLLFIFALFLFLPVIFVLHIIDWKMEKERGNGLFVIAQKKME